MSQGSTGVPMTGGAGTAEGAREVISTAGQEVGALASEAAEQARDLMEQARRQVREVTVQERDRLSELLDGFTSELEQMRSAGTGGTATQVADIVLEKARSLRSAVGDTEPEDMVQGMQRYARMRPATFLAGAVLLGFVVGRVTRTVAGGAASGSSRGDSGRSAADLASTRRVPSPILGDASTSTVTEPYMSSPTGGAADVT